MIVEIAVVVLVAWCWSMYNQIDSLKHDVKVLSNLTARFDYKKKLVYEPCVDWSFIDDIEVEEKHVWCAHLDCGWSGRGECMNELVTEHHELEDECEYYNALVELKKGVKINEN